MRLQSTDLISRATQASSRNLMLMSSGVLLIAFYDLNSKSWEIADRIIEPQQFKEIATVVLIFLSFSHSIHWLSDYTNYTRWFQTSKITSDAMDSLGTFGGGTQPIVDGLKMRVERLVKLSASIDARVVSPDDLAPKGNSTPKDLYDQIQAQKVGVDSIQRFIKSAERDIGDISAILEDIGRDFRRVSIVSGFVVCVWYLVIPLGVCLGALLHLWR